MKYRVKTEEELLNTPATVCDGLFFENKLSDIAFVSDMIKYCGQKIEGEIKPQRNFTEPVLYHNGWGFAEWMLVEVERSIKDGLNEGDIICDARGSERKVLGKAGKIYFLSVPDDFEKVENTLFTLNKLIHNHYELKQN